MKLVPLFLCIIAGHLQASDANILTKLGAKV